MMKTSNKGKNICEEDKNINFTEISPKTSHNKIHGFKAFPSCGFSMNFSILVANLKIMSIRGI